QAADDAAAVGRRSHQIGYVELWLAEELGPAAVLEPDETTPEHAYRRRRKAADRRQLALALVGFEIGEQRAQVGQIEQRELLLVGVPEYEPEALFLRLVRVEHLREELRPEVGDGRAHRHARADPAERQILDRVGGRLKGEPEVLRALQRGTGVLTSRSEP